MLKARRKDQTEQLKFPEPREGLPEDPRPFLGTGHLMAAAAVQEHLSARCLVAVVGRLGSGKSTVCRRAANSRWARQWYLHDEDGHPVHRRFWVDLEDCSPGAETEQQVARALGRPTFAQALARVGDGTPCLLVLDNADHAFGDGGSDEGDTLAQLIACVDRGASVVVTRRSVSGLTIDRPWTDVVEVAGFGTEDEAIQLFELRAPQHAADFRVGHIVATCDRLPLAVNLLGKAAAGADLEQARLRAGPGINLRGGLDFSVELAAAMLDPEARLVWGALSLLPSGLSEDDITEVLAAFGDARERTLRLFALGVAQRCEAGLRIPAPLRLSRSLAALSDGVVSELWGSYVRRAQGVVGPVPPSIGIGGAAGSAGSIARVPASPTRALPRDSVREGPGRRGRNARVTRMDAGAADAWLTRQTATLTRLASGPSRPDNTFDLACAGLLVHRSGIVPDMLDQVLVRLVEAGMAVSGPVSSTAALVPTAGAVPVAVDAVTSPSQASTAGDSPAAAWLSAASSVESAPLDAAAADDSMVAPSNPAPVPPPAPAVDSALAPNGLPAPAPAPASGSAVPAPAASPAPAARAAQIAAALEDQRRFGTAVMLATSVVDVHRRADDTRAVAVALCQLGRAERFCAQYHDAETHLAEARRCSEQLEDGVGQGSALFELGQVDLDLGRLDLAERDLSEALVLFEANGRPVGAANASLDLVRVDLARGRLEVAERRLADAMDRYEAAGDKLGFANACLQLGQVELARAELDSAERRFAGALDGYEQVGDKLGFANACLQLGQVELARGRLDNAERRFSGALAGYERVGDKVGLANASLQLGQIDLARGGLDRAQPRLSHALTAYEDLGDRIGAAHASLQLGQVALGRGELQEAGLRLGAAQAAYDEIGDRMGSANSRHVGALLLQAEGHNSHAMAMFGEAARLYSSMGRTASAGWSLAGAARTCSGKAERMGYAADAVRLLDEVGLSDAASQLALQLAELERPPVPTAMPNVVPEPDAEPISSPWPAVPSVAIAVDPTTELASASASDMGPAPSPAAGETTSSASVDSPPTPEPAPGSEPVAASEVVPGWVPAAASDPKGASQPAGAHDPSSAEVPAPADRAAAQVEPAARVQSERRDVPAPAATSGEAKPDRRSPPESGGDPHADWVAPWSPGVERALLASPGGWTGPRSHPPDDDAVPAPPKSAQPAKGPEWGRWSDDAESTPTPVAGQPAIPAWSTTIETEEWTSTWSTAPDPGLWRYDAGEEGSGPEAGSDGAGPRHASRKPRSRWGRRKER